MPRTDPDKIKGFMSRLVAMSNGSPVAESAKQFDVTRATANRYLDELVQSGDVIVRGKSTRDRRYFIGNEHTLDMSCKIAATVQEEEVWKPFSELLKNRPTNDRYLCSYGFTEMVNNVIDHSGGLVMKTGMKVNLGAIEISVADDGVGIFKKIADALHLSHIEQALLELSKGKFTTDPQRHSGEGIFFTSRMFDKFTILSGNLLFTHTAKDHGGDWLWNLEADVFRGTRVRMKLHLPAQRSLEEVFPQYRGADDEPESGFTRTIVPLNLATIGEEFLVSRSQAKRVLARVNRFKEVILDFDRVESIGQAFADEIFRVFAAEHPEVHITPIRCNSKVSAMIAHVSNPT